MKLHHLAKPPFSIIAIGAPPSRPEILLSTALHASLDLHSMPCHSFSPPPATSPFSPPSGDHPAPFPKSAMATTRLLRLSPFLSSSPSHHLPPSPFDAIIINHCRRKIILSTTRPSHPLFSAICAIYLPPSTIFQAVAPCIISASQPFVQPDDHHDRRPKPPFHISTMLPSPLHACRTPATSQATDHLPISSLRFSPSPSHHCCPYSPSASANRAHHSPAESSIACYCPMPWIIAWATPGPTALYSKPPTKRRDFR